MNDSRRRFLQAGLAIPMVSSEFLRLKSAEPPSFDPWVEIHSGNLLHNVNEIRRLVGSRPILAVIKNNGYGGGVEHVARILESSRAVHGFAVVKLKEAITLRESGIRKPILLMGPFDENGLRTAALRNITPMVYTNIGDLLDRVARGLRKVIPVHICVDTGIGRVGVPYAKAAMLIRELARRPRVRIEGVMMTFTEDTEFDKEQLKRFRDLCNGLEREGVKLGAKHAASTYALFQHKDAFLDMVRPGMGIFGIYPEKEFRSAGLIELRPALALKCRVIYVKQIRAGESAGYNRAYVAKHDVWLATLPVGHADGWPRTAAKGGKVRIRGELFPVIAVSASHTIIEIGSERKANIGDEAVLFDWREGSRPEDVAAACGASVYDLTMHLNPLLTRKAI